MSLVPYKIPPGVARNGTYYQSYGRWYDASLVRFIEGTIRPVGGWVRAATSAMSGMARAMHAWRDNSGNNWCAIGTHSKLYVYSGGSAYDITPVGLTVGRVDSIPGVGYGFGGYGSSTYGTPRPSAPITDATTWSLDNWGQYLLGCSTADGKIYEWLANVSVLPLAVAGAPTGNRAIFVTPERFLVALGASGDPRAVQWCTQEDLTVWTPSATNTAGSLQLQTDGRAIAGRVSRGVGLIWTEQDVHQMNYVGSPLVYGIQRIGAACGLAGPKAVAIAPIGAAWMSQRAFFRYDGASLTQIPCDVADYVFGDINRTQMAKVYAGANSQFNEVWWFYPSAASNENDRYVVWNYQENHWTIGVLGRTCWTDSQVFPAPLAMDPSTIIYQHETGLTNNGAPILTSRYLQSGPVDIAPGDRILNVNQVLPDEKVAGQVQLRFSTQFTPEGATWNFGPYLLSPYTDVRFAGRQAAMKIEGLADADWRVGDFRLNVVPGGKR